MSRYKIPECPFCSKGTVFVKLVKRVGKYGQFWGCPNFPRCHYSESLNGPKSLFPYSSDDSWAENYDPDYDIDSAYEGLWP